MLTEKTLAEADILAKELTTKSLVLKPVGDSPLIDLIADCTPMDTSFKNPFDMMKAVSEASRNVLVDGNIRHSCDMEKFAWGLSKSLESTLSLARNLINPMVNEVTTIIEEKIDNGVYFDSGIKIVSYFIPDIMKSGHLEELTDRYQTVPYTPIDWPNDTWPIMSAEVLRKATKGKSNSLNKLIEDFLEDLTDSVIVEVYNYLFRSEILSSGDLSDNIINVLGFLWATTWINDVPENISVNLKTLSLNLTAMKSNCGKAIQDNLKKFERMSNQGYFIIKTPNSSIDKKTFIVQGEIYNKWLEKGNSPEILIGALISNNIGNLANISDEQKKIWIRRYKLDTDIRKLNFETKKQTIIAKELSNFIDKVIDEKALDKKETRKRFNQIIVTKPYKIYNNIPRWVRMVLCEALYPNSDILNILSNIDNILNFEPQTPARDAATMASIDLIIDWFFSAMSVEYVGV